MNTIIEKAQTAIDSILGMETKEKLDALDQQTLDDVGQMFGGIKVAPIDLDMENPTTVSNVLSIDALNQVDLPIRNAALERLRLALRARLGASCYHPQKVTINQIDYVVHNRWAQLQSTYSAQQIQDLLALLQQKGVFTLHTDENTGLVRTAETRNALMRRQWLTDGSFNGYLQKQINPQAWQRVMLVHAAVLNTPEALYAINQTITDPKWYRESTEKLNGIFHIFDPSSVQFDPKTGMPILEKIIPDADFNRKRMESFALVLGDLVDTMRAGFSEERAAWGFNKDFLTSPHRFDTVAKAVVNLSRYLLAINTNPKTGEPDMAAPSGSSWEEAPFPGGMTSDVGLTVVAFTKLRDLLFNPKYDANKELQKVRLSLWHSEGGDVLRNPQVLDALIKAGQDVVTERVVKPLESGKPSMQHPNRDADTSLLILGASDFQFDRDKSRDARIRYDLCCSMETKLRGEHGILRYDEFTLENINLYDSYLNDCFHMPPAFRAATIGQAIVTKDHGSKDTSGVADLAERQALSSPQHAAQWGLGVSATLQTLARAKSELLEHMRQTKVISPADDELLKKINAKIVDYINFNIALISGPLEAGKKSIRADGTDAPEDCVMEAFEIVRDLDGNPKWIPGAHTLAWGASQLFDGLRLARQAAIQEEYDSALRKVSELLVVTQKDLKQKKIANLLQQIIDHAQTIEGRESKVTLAEALNATHKRLLHPDQMSHLEYENIAKKMQSDSSPGLNVLGGIMLALAIAVLVLGVVFFPAVVATAGAVVGAAAATATAAGAVGVTTAVLGASSAVGFFAGRERGLRVDMRKLNDEVLKQHAETNEASSLTVSAMA